MDPELIDLYKKQISLTEWFEAIGHSKASALRAEDAAKHDRLTVLNEVIGLPFGKPTRFSAQDVAERSAALRAFVKEHGEEPCAIRLIPKVGSAPKLRIRGYRIKDTLAWFDEQHVNPAHYDVDFVPHDNPKWTSIFIVTDRGIYGEVKRGDPSQLTQGIYTDEPPTSFSFDFTQWHLSQPLPGAEAHLREVTQKLLVADPAAQKKLQQKLDATFSHNYVKGYFETSTSDEYGIWFIDYNRLLGDLYAEVNAGDPHTALVSGRTGSPGKAAGRVRIVSPDAVATTTLASDEVLVCTMTTPDYIALMQQAAAIVTDLGGVLSHAAIIARELKKPCITGTKNATAKLTDGQAIIVDADSGNVQAA